jgi:hypothetical protein
MKKSVFEQEDGETILREQKTAKVGCRFKGMLKTKSNNGARNMVALEPAEKDGANKLNHSFPKIVMAFDLDAMHIKQLRKPKNIIIKGMSR